MRWGSGGASRCPGIAIDAPRFLGLLGVGGRWPQWALTRTRLSSRGARTLGFLVGGVVHAPAKLVVGETVIVCVVIIVAVAVAVAVAVSVLMKQWQRLGSPRRRSSPDRKKRVL